MDGVRGACLRVGSGMSEWVRECRGGSVKSPEVRGLAMCSQQAEINEELRRQVELNGSAKDWFRKTESGRE